MPAAVTAWVADTPHQRAVARYGCTLFPREVPPLLAFNRGTVGFLTPFDPTDYKGTLSAVIRGGTPIHARKRLDVAVHSSGQTFSE